MTFAELKEEFNSKYSNAQEFKCFFVRTFDNGES